MPKHSFRQARLHHIVGLILAATLTLPVIADERDLHPELFVPLDNFAPGESNLFLAVEDSAIFQVISEDGITYSGGNLEFSVDGPLFCMDFGTNTGPMRLFVEDSGAHPVIDLALGADALLAYDGNGGLVSGAPGPTSFIDFAQTANCFYLDDNDQFSFSATIPPLGDHIFLSRFDDGVFEPQNPDLRDLQVYYDNLPAQIFVGETFGYQLVVENNSSESIATVGLQELLPRDDRYFDAVVLNQLTVNCSADNGADCGDIGQPTGSPPVLQEFLRSETLALPGHSSVTINITRTLFNDPDQRGHDLILRTGVVAGDGGLFAFPPAHDAAEVRIPVVSPNTWISADTDESFDPDNPPAVTDLTAEAGGAGMVVTAFDSDPETGDTFRKYGVDLVVESVAVQECIKAIGGCEWQPLDEVAGGWGNSDTGAVIDIVPPSATTSFPDPNDETDEGGEAFFEAFSELAAEFRVTFAVAAEQAQSLQLTAEGSETAQTEIAFQAAEPDNLSLANTPPQDITAGECEAVELLVSDAFDNPVSEAGVEVTVAGAPDLPACFDPTAPAVTNGVGVAVFHVGSNDAGTLELDFELVADPQVAVDVPIEIDSGVAESLLVQFDGAAPEVLIVGETVSGLAVTAIDAFGNPTSLDGSAELFLRESTGSGTSFLAFIDGFALVDGVGSVNDFVVPNEPGSDRLFRAEMASSNIQGDSNPFDIDEAESLSVNLAGFAENYAPGDSQDGTEQVEFSYQEGLGEIEQIFNVFRVFHADTGEELTPAEYQAMFDELSYVPADYIRGLSGPSADNVVSPAEIDVSVQFVIGMEPPLGTFDLEITSYDVTGIAPEEVSLDDTATYDVLDGDSLQINLNVP